MGKWIFVPLTKLKRQRNEKSTQSSKHSAAIRKVKDVLKMKHPDNLEVAVAIALGEIREDKQQQLPQQHQQQQQPVQKLRRFITIPRKGSDIDSLVPLFVGLTTIGLVPEDVDAIIKAVMVTSKARKELAEGLQSTEDTELFDNLILKLHKSGLALHTKS